MKVYACGYVSEPKYRNVGRIGIAVHATDQRKYSWRTETKRRVRSKVVALHSIAKRGYFITLTQKESIENNRPIALFLSNLKKRGYVKDFVWVRERQKRGANHYHVYFTSDKFLFDGSQNSRKNLAGIFQEAWNSSQRTCGGVPSSNSMRFGDRPVVHGNGGQIANYLTKYMTKADKEMSEKYRLTASSRGIEYVVSVGIAYDYILGRPAYQKTTEFAYIAFYSVDDRWWSTAIELSHYLNNNFNKNGSFDDCCGLN